jgi:hypothetical protein
MLISIIIASISFLPRLYYAKKFFSLSYRRYFFEVICKISLPFLFALMVGRLFDFIVDFNIFIFGFFIVAISLLFIYLFGLFKSERKMIRSFIKKYL